MPEMTTFENQRIITTEKAKYEREFFFFFLKTHVENGYETLNRLTPNAFKLWFYMNLNADGYTYGLSKAHCTAICGMSKNTYRKAFNELVECGYLIETGANHYRFREITQKPD